jgi:hypothetical protein
MQHNQVGSVSLPQGRLPEVIVYERRVFAYYVHTTAQGQIETEHPYREVRDVLFATAADSIIRPGV